MTDRKKAEAKKAEQKKAEEKKQWEVEYTDEFEDWWNGLTEAEQEDITAVVGVLQKNGPSLRRPYVGPIVTAKHPNMKELSTRAVPTGCFSLSIPVAQPYC